MSHEIKHADDTPYPPHFAESKKLSADILRHLCPHVFRTGEILKRNVICERIKDYHIKITGNEISQTTGEIGTAAKKSIFNENSNLFEVREGVGNYEYIGTAYGEGYILPEDPVEDEVEETDYVPQQHLEAKDNGRELLYVWWHNDSEELANLKDITKWAMKVGKHNSPNVGNRFSNYTVAVPHHIKLGLTVSCANSSNVERAVHSVLNNRGAKINEEGKEWYLTNIDEVLEILRFHYLID